MIPSRFLLLAAVAAGALAGCAGNPGLAPGLPISPDRAAGDCRERIFKYYAAPTSTGTLNKVGPVETLYNVQLYNLFKVHAPNARLYRARVQVTNILGIRLDRYDVCFFKQQGNAYHFVQICHSEGLTSRLPNCSAVGLG